MKPVIIIAIAFVLLIPISVFAVDFQDSTGYTPSWAIGQWNDVTMMKCTEIIRDNSNDGNWCFEWATYIEDQGIENYPDSISAKEYGHPEPLLSDHLLSERECIENQICALGFDVLLYRNWDSYADSEGIGLIRVVDEIRKDSITFSTIGFGFKELTYSLDLKTGFEKNSEYGIDRPFNFIEPIPMKIGQDVYRIIADSYESSIEEENTMNFKEIGLIDMERTIAVANIDNGENGAIALMYDKETGVLVEKIEKYFFEGKEYRSTTVLIDTNIFSIPTKIIPSLSTALESASTKTIAPKTTEQVTTTLPEISSKSELEGGGCLIATATYGSELSPQVQQLRELRDNQLLNTESGTSFMNSFNDFYYSFSPIIADYERENPIFKEAVKIAITPMISSLSILNYVDMDSEAEVLGYGISLIILNGMMYVGIPAIIIMRIRK